jgi:hypothetical protein
LKREELRGQRHYIRHAENLPPPTDGVRPDPCE